jgi:uncharacterized protein YlzI (FlbEa/FlbD family)
MIELTPDEHKILVDAIQDSATVVHKGRKDMNERIRQLKEQAMEWVPNMADPDTKIRLLNAEKFAELIVKECIEKITTYDLVPGHSAKWEDIYDIHTRLIQDLGEELKEHFGVTK